VTGYQYGGCSIAAVIPVSGSPFGLSPEPTHPCVCTREHGTISVISSLSNSVTSASASGGAGANFMLYDKFSNFLYVTNPAAGSSAYSTRRATRPATQRSGSRHSCSHRSTCAPPFTRPQSLMLGDGSAPMLLATRPIRTEQFVPKPQ